MPTFTTIALDRLLEPGASKSVEKSLPKLKPGLNSNRARAPNSKLDRRNSTSVVEKKVQRPQIKPALYVTPEATPLPDSPSSFSPSPYLINHKRRGPRLMKSFSEDDVSHRKVNDKEKGNGSVKALDNNDVKLTEAVSVTFEIPVPNTDEQTNEAQVCDGSSNCAQNGGFNVDHGVTAAQLEGNNGNIESSVIGKGVELDYDPLKSVVLNTVSVGDSEDFFEAQESLSVASNTDGEDNGVERSLKLGTPMGEFYDAWEEISSEGGPRPASFDLSLLAEIEKRNQAEEALQKLQDHWQRLRERLLPVGLTLPAAPTDVADGEIDSDPGEELCQQIYLAKFVSNSIGRGIARAEVEAEMEARLEAKNFEIARLLDRLHYYEAVNREMSQRNQEAVDLARRERLKKKRRQRWMWGTIAAAITIGTTVLAWSYLPSGKDSSSPSVSLSSDDYSEASGPVDATVEDNY